MSYGGRILRGWFILLMAAAGLGKLADMPGFYPVVTSYRLLPEGLVAPSAWALALLELGVAAWLLWGRRLPQAVLALIALHLFYLFSLCQALLRDLVIANCGCFGVYWPRALSRYSPIEDLCLLMLAALLWRQARRAPA